MQVQRAAMRGAFGAVRPTAPRVVPSVAAPMGRALVVDVEAGNGKLKTRKAAAKRFKITGSGKVMARRAGKNHFNEKKTRDDIRDASKMYVLSSANLDNAIKCLPNSGIGR